MLNRESGHPRPRASFVPLQRLKLPLIAMSVLLSTGCASLEKRTSRATRCNESHVEITREQHTIEKKNWWATACGKKYVCSYAPAKSTEVNGWSAHDEAVEVRVEETAE